jgi:uncharacterized coiled-coil protein SlyX
MHTKDMRAVSIEHAGQLGEALARNKELSQRIAQLERRAAFHDTILNFLKTILDRLKESNASLYLTEAQRAELNRWLDDYERITDGALPGFDIN